MKEKARKDVIAFEENMEKNKQKIEDANNIRIDTLRKVEKQTKENECLKTKIDSLRNEAEKLNEIISQNKKSLEEHERIDLQIEKLKAELKNYDVSLLNNTNKSGKTIEQLEEIFREKSGQESNLEKCLIQARSTLSKLKDQSPEGPQNLNIPNIENNKEPKDMEKVKRENNEWKDRCKAITQQLFEAKVAWAEENNNLQLGMQNLSQTLDFTSSRIEQLKIDYDNVKTEYNKIKKKLNKCIAKKK